MIVLTKDWSPVMRLGSTCSVSVFMRFKDDFFSQDGFDAIVGRHAWLVFSSLRNARV